MSNEKFNNINNNDNNVINNQIIINQYQKYIMNI